MGADLTLSAVFAPSAATPDDVRCAERLGYTRAWMYDSPALYADVWMTLARSAAVTSTIGLGPAVLVPSLRHPIANAAAVAALADLAPGRVEVAVGAGFTGRLTLGQRPLPWRGVRDHVAALQRLLAGQTVSWEGSSIRLLQPPGFGAGRPLRVPMLLGTGGPKGEAAARELADGIFALRPSPGFARCAVLTVGTVLADGEAPDAERAVLAARAAGALAVHVAHLRGDVTALPGGQAWLAALEAVPAAERHLALHEGHLIDANERDRPVVTPQLLTTLGCIRDRDQWRDHLAALAAGGATEVAYQPTGPDIPGELARFAAMAR